MERETDSQIINEASRRILQYLRELSNAQDMESIATWWIMQQRLHESVFIVREGLQKLEARGLVAKHRTSEGRVLYWLNTISNKRPDE